MEKQKTFKRLVLSEPVLTAFNMLKDDNYSQVELINALVSYGKGEDVDIDKLYFAVGEAYKYLTDNKRIDSVFVDDKYEYE
jgi:hypothetical protein